MKIKRGFIVPIVSACGGLALGLFVADFKYSSLRLEALNKNYTDRARICLEAAALLRSNQPHLARTFLEDRAMRAIHGVPLGRAYDELSPDSQRLMVAAKLYDAKFDDMDWEMERLIREVPDDHPGLSIVLRSVTGKFGE